MTRDEVINLINEMPEDEVETHTREELKGYLADDAELIPENIGPALAEINAEIDTKRKKNTKKH